MEIDLGMLGHETRKLDIRRNKKFYFLRIGKFEWTGTGYFNGNVRTF